MMFWMPPFRGSGQTTDLMTEAPPGSLYFWCNDLIDYPKALAKHLGRDDLRIVPYSDVRDYPKYHGCRFRGVIFDHACSISPKDANEVLKFRACAQWFE